MKIRDGFVDNIGANATSAARELRRNLIKFADDDNAFSVALDAFEQACNGRDAEDVTRDAMMINSLMRSRARELEIMEFPGTLAFDSFEPSFGAGSSVNRKARLSPRTCNVVTRFTGVAAL